MIEMLLIVAFIAIASIAVYIVYQKITVKNMITDETVNMKRIVLEIQPIIASNNKVELDADFLVQYGIIDKNRVTNNLYNNYIGSQVSFSSLYSNSINKISHLKVQYLNIDKEVCSLLINSYADKADFISIGLTVVKNTIDPEYYVDYSMPKAFQICNEVGLSNAQFPIIIAFSTQSNR